MQNKKWHKQTLAVLKLSILAGILGSILSSYQAYSIGPIEIRYVMNGVIDGFLIVFLLSSYTLIITEFFLNSYYKRLNFTSNVLLHSLSYVILILIGRATGRYIMEYDYFILFPIKGEIERLHFLQAISLALIGSVLFHFFLQVNHLLGPRILSSFITGRYHAPIAEERIILFLDITSSTRIAEELGDEKYLRFLDSFFNEFTEPILETGAEIYKYVGDEIILTWPKEAGLKNSNCLTLFNLLDERLSFRQKYYKREFNNIPEYRAGMHIGWVMTGEMGDLKKEIVHVGDVMNTAARLAGHCRVTNDRLILSETLSSLIKLPSEWKVIPLGPTSLRGKKEPMAVVSLINETGRNVC